MNIETVKAALRRTARFSVYATHAPKLVNRWRFRERPDVLFVWIPKSAGTSIYNWLAAEIGMVKLKETMAIRGGLAGVGPVTLSHYSVTSALERGHLPEAFFRRAFKFAVGRNPFARSVSLYNYLQLRGRVRESFAEFLERVEAGVEPVGPYNSRGLSQANPQVDWVTNNGRVFLDQFWRLEDQQWAADLAGRLGCRSTPARLNQSRATGTAHYADEANVTRVLRYYHDDFEAFGYSRTVPETP